MRLAVLRSIALVVLLLISPRILGASGPGVLAKRGHTIHAHESGTSAFLQSILFEKTENENGKTLEEDTNGRAILIDFDRQACSLCSYHSPQVPVATTAFLFDVRPPLHQFNCVFQI